ncbi:aminotransferase class V-fold PLP-dependent enzyme [SAR202 cluster bacterium AD-804-J14_MRT_500m]|nr:aminotransferase class V-fold PLP-dependent enzyme [SAR202 cluster bacterium AD-804-J14_MRT_500m]
MITETNRGTQLNIENIRKQIPACQEMVYMNTGWSGPSPQSVVEAITDRLRYESYQGPMSPPVYESGKIVQQDAKEAVASLFNVTADEVILTQCTTDGLNIVLNGLPWNPGDEVITFSLEHSSVLIPAYHLQQRYGVIVRVVELKFDDSEDAIIGKVAEVITKKTRLVFCSHIQYTCGLKMPVERIRCLTVEKGIKMLLDGAQTGGHISLDLASLGCEFYSIPGQKWLMGPDGVGALYIRKDVIPAIKPLRVSGRAVTTYDEEGGYEPNDESIDKFLLTTNSAPLAAGFATAIRFHESIGSNSVESRVIELSSMLKELLTPIQGVTLASPTNQSMSCGLTTFRISGWEPDQAVSKLWEDHKIVIRQVRELAAVRASTHVFNTEDEVDQLVQAVSDMVS